MNRKLVYISGPIGTESNKSIERNVNEARELALKIWKIGHVYPIVPHLNSPWTTSKDSVKLFNDLFKSTDDPHSAILEADLAMLEYTDAIFMMPKWKSSAGAVIEHDYAIEHNIPVFYDLESLSIFLNRNPKQCKACKRIRKHLNDDYGGLFCNDCYPVIQSAVHSELQKDSGKFLKVPKL